MGNRKQSRPFWQPQPCPPWCAFDEDHSPDDAYVDRSHYSAYREIALTVEDPTDRDPRDAVEPTVARIELNQHYREIEPRIWLGKDETRQGMHLTLGEARQLADELMRAVDMAVGHCGPESTT